MRTDLLSRAGAALAVGTLAVGTLAVGLALGAGGLGAGRPAISARTATLATDAPTDDADSFLKKFEGLSHEADGVGDAPTPG